MGDISIKGHGIERRNTRRENRLEELGRVDAERGYSRKGKRNLKEEKKRIVRELRADGGRIGAKDGKWIQKVNKSIEKRGTKGKCTPITKPGCTGRAKALAKTFKKWRKQEKHLNEVSLNRRIRKTVRSRDSSSRCYY